MMHKDKEYFDYEPTPVEDFTERLKEEEKPVQAPVVRVEKPQEKKPKNPKRKKKKKKKPPKIED